ncbi:hypothetical protein EV360DRAFT_90132 [Lentinula raphanica]|nr:hypothetical protein EV360DRAFT_90132 [Lentinula raphanica]
MSTLKRSRDTFYHDAPPSKRASPRHNTHCSPLGTIANGHTHFPPTPLSNIKPKQEHFSAIQRPGERKEAEDKDEEEEPESQLPTSEREHIQRDLQKKYDDLMLDFKTKSFEVTILEGKMKVAQAQLSSSQEQLRLLTESRQDLINEFQKKQQKYIQTEQRLRAERDRSKKDLAVVQAEKDGMVLERNAAQRANNEAQEELQDYRQFFTSHARLLAGAQARNRAP